MQFEEGHIYHIFNRGNNSVKIFYKKENYLFFIKKIEKYILPYTGILAWCLMPTHFHLLIYVRNVILGKQDLNHSIGIMLRSYTRAIQNQESFTGSLFQQGTKAKCLSEIDSYKTSFQTVNGITVYPDLQNHLQYPVICFNYIHFNPVRDGLANQPEDWEFSSYSDYLGVSKYAITDKDLAYELLDLPEDKDEFRKLSSFVKDYGDWIK